MKVDRPDLDGLFADLSHPNPHLQTQAYLAMVEHWPDQAMPSDLEANLMKRNRLLGKAKLILGSI